MVLITYFVSILNQGAKNGACTGDYIWCDPGPAGQCYQDSAGRHVGRQLYQRRRVSEPVVL